MDKVVIVTLEIVEDFTRIKLDNILIKLYCTQNIDLGISEESMENTDLVNTLVRNIPTYKLTKRKNAIINHLVKSGLRMVAITSNPISIDSGGEITQLRTEVYFESPKKE